MATDNIWDPDHKYDHQESPFLVEDGALKKFRPTQALKYLQDDRYWSGEKKIVLAGLVAWMIAPRAPIKTSTRNVRKLSGTEFIYQAMLVSAAEQLDRQFYDARKHQWYIQDYSREALLEFLEQDDADFDLFFVLGGFGAILNNTSMPEFCSNLENQALVVEHACTVFQALKVAQDAHTPLAQKTVFEQLSKGTPQRKRGGGPSTLRGHWEALVESAPLLFAASEIGNGELIRQIFRREPWGVKYRNKFEWVGPWVSRAEEIARLLNDTGWDHFIWPPAECVAD